MNTFNHVTDPDLAYFRKLLPGRVFSGEEISTDYDHDEMTEYGHFLPEAVLSDAVLDEAVLAEVFFAEAFLEVPALFFFAVFAVA